MIRRKSTLTLFFKMQYTLSLTCAGTHSPWKRLLLRTLASAHGAQVCLDHAGHANDTGVRSETSLALGRDLSIEVKEAEKEGRKEGR